MNGYTYLPDKASENIGITSSVRPSIIHISNSNYKEVVRIDAEGRIFWLGREVTTDEEFRQTMLELHKAFTTR